MYTIDELKLTISELKSNLEIAKNTCIELSKRANYSDEEKDKYWEFECECGLIGLSCILLGGEQIADTGDYGNAYCPCCGKIVD